MRVKSRQRRRLRGTAKKKQVFPVFSFLCMYFPGVWSVMCVLCVLCLIVFVLCVPCLIVFLCALRGACYRRGVWGRLRLHLPAAAVLRRIGAGDVVARPFATPLPGRGEPHLAIVGAVVLVALPGERVRLAVIGTGPGERSAALSDVGDLGGLSGGGEVHQLDLIDARLVALLSAVIVRESVHEVPVVAVAVGEFECALLVLLLDLVGIERERETSEVATAGELEPKGVDLLLATALMVRNVLLVDLLLERQVAILGLGADAHGSIDAGLRGTEIIDTLANGAAAHAVLEVGDLVAHILGGDGDLERDGRDGGHAWSAWWYFDSTSFPYQLPWRFSLSIFFGAAGSAGIGVTRRRAPGKCVTRVSVCQGHAGPCNFTPGHSKCK